MQIDMLIQWIIEVFFKLYNIPVTYLIKNYKLLKISFERYKLKEEIIIYYTNIYKQKRKFFI